MKSFALQRWDDGRLTVNCQFADVLRAAGLTTFDSLVHYTGGRVAKNLLPERTTTRIELPADDGELCAFYLKRHAAPPWKEYVKPWLRLTRPILGARNEWNAILEFHKVGLPTMTPVAVGEAGRRSFLLTESIDGCVKLSEWLENGHVAGDDGPDEMTEAVIHHVADTARKMHEAGLHHQDFYLTHLLVPADDPGREVYVIDLGRVRRRKRLSSRWIIKDLAQFNYSARALSQPARRRFLENYLGRPLRESDRPFLQRIDRKTEAIGRHSRRNRL